jgi:hypothetical protein
MSRRGIGDADPPPDQMQILTTVSGRLLVVAPILRRYVLRDPRPLTRKAKTLHDSSRG